MKKTVAMTSLLALSTGILGSVAPLAANAAAPTSTSTHASVNSVDRAFVKGNDQVNLAEIALGKLGEKKAQNAETRMLAKVTLRDHVTAESKLRKVAKADGITLPAEPSKAQLKVAKTLQGMSKATFDVAYDKAEVLGHEASISATKKEFAKGQNSAVESYAHYYLPVAKKHLAMAKAALKASKN